MQRYDYIGHGIQWGKEEQRAARARRVLLNRRATARVNRGVWQEPKVPAKCDIADLYVAREKRGGQREEGNNV